MANNPPASLYRERSEYESPTSVVLQQDAARNVSCVMYSVCVHGAIDINIGVYAFRAFLLFSVVYSRALLV